MDDQEQAQIGQDGFVIDNNDFNALNENDRRDGNSPQQMNANNDGDQVADEEGGGGFFITGVNTQDAPVEDPIPQPLQEYDEEQEDPMDKYRHVAVVDCSKAFSDKEVSDFESFIIL